MGRVPREEFVPPQQAGSACESYERGGARGVTETQFMAVLGQTAENSTTSEATSIPEASAFPPGPEDIIPPVDVPF
jgi:hypothetical protein